jgi:hypothetical protein
MRRLAKSLVVVLLLVGLFSYLSHAGLTEEQVARRLQQSFGAPTGPAVEVSSNFPPEMLLGRIDRVQVTIDQGVCKAQFSTMPGRI